METNFLTKVATNISWQFRDNFEKCNFLSKTAMATFGAPFWENWATFYSNIWSHLPLALAKGWSEWNISVNIIENVFLCWNFNNIIFCGLGGGCGSVGWAVASDSRGPRFESSRHQIFSLNIYCQLCWKDENNRKRGQEWPILKKTIASHVKV